VREKGIREREREGNYEDIKLTGRVGAIAIYL
jgi:hypothetical protein